ncbi:uncharacterized protein LOC123557170 [Mercenaria mercenaria]|uniref:uncharacterized protein LOC123557170 n=1 Tax=Mercenaria mercenaria TaxID=6596 RepID=UPI00234F89C5|nr:uncharacterized protein LOC123557170 [Mercenaria mercenaria]
MTETGLKFTKDDESSFDEKEELLSNSLKTKTSLPFKNSGECSDEVVLNFDDGKKLYVSENFLCYASPVFKAMFTHDSKEKETKEVAMKQKVFDDVLEFLLCLHPGVQKPVDNDNVLPVVSLAEEYQVNISVKRCQNVMKNWLTSEVESAVEANDNLKRASNANVCLEILTKAEACGFEELVTHAIEIIARFGHEVFTGRFKATQVRIASPQLFARPVISAKRRTEKSKQCVWI